jgi:hypothetical protein
MKNLEIAELEDLKAGCAAAADSKILNFLNS